MRNWDRPGNIKPYIATLNRIRRANPALQQSSHLRFLGIEDGHVIGFVKQAADNIVAVAVALTSGLHEFWLPLGDVQLGTGPAQRPVTAVENLVTGERHALEWGGTRLRIDPATDPALLLRCVA